MNRPPAYERRFAHPSGSRPNGDSREEGQRDRDRILYSSAFRRLTGVTQVVGPLEGHIFHNRLTHTIEVAQIARRIAEKLKRDHPARMDERGGLDPEVVEAAALAHDLGHPPFGHVAEKELDRLALDAGAVDGFEGNAQSFRILTRLAAHREDYRGLNHTRATLNAVLKYPWYRGENAARPDKFGAYRSDAEDFEFARAGFTTQSRSLEALIMDHADAVAYSVHDLDDFYRAGLVPLEQLRHDFDQYLERFKASGKVTPEAVDRQETALWNLVQLLPVERRYGATYEERVQLRTATSRLIDEFVSGLELSDGPDDLELKVPEDREVRMRFLQRLVWDHVIENPRLATQQHGQREIIRGLFRVYLKAIRDLDRTLIPGSFQKDLDEVTSSPKNERAAEEVRLAVDIVASLTDRQATTLHRRLTGVAPGSVTDILWG